MKQSTALPSITINGKEINCYEGDYIEWSDDNYKYYSISRSLFSTISANYFLNIDTKFTNYEKSYRDGKLKTIKYFL